MILRPNKFAVAALILAASIILSANARKDVPTTRAKAKPRAATEQEFHDWVVQEYNVQAGKVMFDEVDATWNYQTNITENNQHVMVAASGVTANFTQVMSKLMKDRFSGVNLKNESLKRVFTKLSKIGDAALSAEKFKELSELKAQMEETYSTAKVCGDPAIEDISKCPPDLIWSLDPQITHQLDTSRDPVLLKHLWTSWRDQSGKKMKDQYKRYIELKNEAARANGYANNAEAWRAPYVEPDFDYTDANFLEDIKKIWEQTRPLYQQLHAYVRAKLIREYANKTTINPFGPIPAHLLGNMWAQTWLGVLNFTQLFPSKPALDVSAEMKRQNWSAVKMFQTSDKFFSDLGLIAMPEEFWNKSMILKPDGREVTCHASAWDFYNGKDFRIKQCTTVNMQDLFTVHHEMGHIEYFLQYKDQWISFRDGANDGFHEAIGDTLALSVSTPKHLEKLGLLSGHNASDTEMDLNFMFSTALEKIAFLPFGLMMDMYRYDVFSGKIGTDELNEKWLKYIVEYQGVCSPVPRSEDDFDAGSKYHVPADVPYMRYFVSFIIQFQFHEAMCKAANQTGPLYTCDIDGSKEAGRLMAEALALGSSRPWQVALEKLTGGSKMDARPLLNFFQPLYEYLENKNLEMGSYVGWTNDPVCRTGSGGEKHFEEFVNEVFNPNAEAVIYTSQEASWAYNTNLTTENEAAMIAASAVSADFDKRIYETVLREFNHSHLQNQTLLRIHDKLTKLGDAALPADKFKELAVIGARMSSIYSTALVCSDPAIHNIEQCPQNQRWALEPNITQALAHSRDPKLLLHLWKSWRDESGKKMRTDYARYVELKNEAARIDKYANNAEAWRAPYVEPTLNYTDANFLSDIKGIWEQVQPLYKELHAYVRRKLGQQYANTSAVISQTGPIPAHLLGNMWAQTWGNIQDFTQLYPGKPALDVTPEMVKQGYTPLRMFQTADKFFTDLGLIAMPNEFWNKSMLVKPEGRNVTCHASAWDFYNRKDFRIKQCTDVTMEDLLTVHHEMGHVEYYLQYKNLPVPFRRGANDGFHEAIGDTLSLSVATPGHLQKIGLGNFTKDEEMDKNYMFSTALDKIAFLPFGLMMDMYRYDIFSGKISSAEYNTKWWDYILEYQGICAPVNRSENDFDPGAKYHIPADTPYMRYFVSFIIQFQFHKALCIKANQTGPLHECDINESKAAGAQLAKALSLGSSVPWQVVMKELTGSDKMDAQPLLDYFEPVYQWLQKDNTDNNAKVGWTSETTCPQNANDHATTQRPGDSSTQGSASITATVSLLIAMLFVMLFVQ